MMNKFPWESIKIPPKGNINLRAAKRCNGATYFWGRGSEGLPCFSIRYSGQVSPQSKMIMPEFSSQLLEIISDDTSVAFFLKDSTLANAFFLLCQNIIFAVGASDSATEVYSKLVRHLSDWQKLLQKKRKKLSGEQEMGLVSELFYLFNVLRPKFGSQQALQMWTGPLGRPKDFEVGTTCVEVKATGSSNSDSIKISSEGQLDTEGLTRLFLYICNVSSSGKSGEETFTLDGLIAKYREMLVDEDELLSEFFYSLVQAYGYSEEDDYSKQSWSCSEIGTYEVADDFPRLIPSNIPAGLHHVKYRISLANLKKYKVATNETVEG